MKMKAKLSNVKLFGNNQNLQQSSQSKSLLGKLIEHRIGCPLLTANDYRIADPRVFSKHSRINCPMVLSGCYQIDGCIFTE
jgi:hypothetical protein